MKVKKTSGFKRVIAFIVALTTIASATMITSYAEKNKESKEIVNYVDDYTSLFPGLKDSKMKLSDPVFSDKDWYEYIEYEFYSEVVDGDMTYRIYKPTDFSAASIMAITDYDPKKNLGMSGGNITMNLGELQGIFDMAQQGSNISKDFAGINIASGIANTMNNIGDVMDNAKYYSSSSFLGIPGDDTYKGVSNDGFFNNDSLEIEITETETVSVCKTVAIDSSYSISDTTVNGKDSSSYSEASDLRSNTHEESVYEEESNTVGKAIGDSTSSSAEISSLLSTSVGWEVTQEHTQTDEFHGNVIANVEACVGVDSSYVKDSIGYEIGDSHSVTDSVSASSNGSITSEVGMSAAVGSEHSVTQNTEKTNLKGTTSGDSSTIEHGLTSGKQEGVTYENAKEMAVNIGYGVDYQYGNEHSISLGVKRVFNARDDKEVKNVGWKLCEYIVKVPYYIEAVKTDASGEETVLYGQYVNYNLLNGVSRVFANGYIEHWYTGELVTYADFFDGFVTATELVDKAKAQQAVKADSLS